MFTLDIVLFIRTSNDENDGHINAFSNMIFYDINVNVRLLAQKMGKQNNGCQKFKMSMAIWGDCFVVFLGHA